jgi:CDP-glycerol glycerophosphotransferase
MVRSRGRLWADLPFRGDPRLRRSVFRPHWRDSDPVVGVDDIGWRGDRLVITGRANVPSLDITKRRHTTKLLVMLPKGRRPPIVIPARSFLDPEATAISWQERYNYEWSGFRCEISPRWFRVAGRWITGDWECYMLVRNRGVWRPTRLHTPSPGKPERPEAREIAPGLRFGARWSGLNLHVGIWRTDAVLAGYSRTDGAAPGDAAVEIDVDVRGQAGTGEQPGGKLGGKPGTQPGGKLGEKPPEKHSAELVLRRQRGAARLAFPAPGNPAAAVVPLSSLTAAADSANRAVPFAQDQDETAWDVYIKGKGRVAWPEGMAETRFLSGAREVVVGRSRYGDLVMAERTPRPVIDEHSWLPDGRLRLSGTFLRPTADDGSGSSAEASDSFVTVLRRRTSSDEHVLPFTVDGERFTIEIDVSRMTPFGDVVPLRDGEWELFVRGKDARSASTSLAGLKYDHARLGDVTEKRVEVGKKLYRLMASGFDDPVIFVEPKLRVSEQGNFNARLLRRGYYRVLKLRAPLRDSIFFVSWKGKQCGDNPRGIADELRRRGDDREHFWAVNDWSVPVPPGSTPVLYGTQEYYDALARSRYLIANDDMQPPYWKRDGQVYLQTWHGTPLKRIGFDIKSPQFISGTAYFDYLATDVAKWDLLISPNPFSTPIMRSAFRYDGEICEYGYPRNDAAFRDGDGALAARVRQRLGLPAGKKVVLYAPTWRDNQIYASGQRYRFDLRLDLERAWKALGDDHVLLLRGHHQSADDVQAGVHPDFVVNVTGYPDIADLFLVSDVLITDYSSVMFDFAPTGKPMLFFTYDLAEYRDNLRGFYFDFEAEAPGPLLATSDDVITAIADIDAVAARHSAAYAAFTAKFCPLDDGKASARACDRLFGA